MASLQIREFRLLRLILEGVGPFRERFEISFTGADPEQGEGPAAHRPRVPANFYLLMSQNGFGKTTILEMIYFLFGLLNREFRQSNDEKISLFGKNNSQAQMDVWGLWEMDGKEEHVLLSICITGDAYFLESWPKDRLKDVGNADEWALVSIRPSKNKPSEKIAGIETSTSFSFGTVVFVDNISSNKLGKMLLESIGTSIFQSSENIATEFLLPEILYFTADRSVARFFGKRMVTRPEPWGYQTAVKFHQDGTSWENSLDCLLTWLTWLDDGSLDRVKQYVHDYVFLDGHKTMIDVDRATMMGMIHTPTGEHPIDQLSHGERSLLQMFIRIFSHMSNCTIILIDEMEIHLHPRWRTLLMKNLKKLVSDMPGISIIASTHERDMIRYFEHTRLEKGLVKNGFLIEKGME